MNKIEILATEKCRFLEQRVKEIFHSMKKMSKLQNSLAFSKEIALEIDK